MDKRWSKLTAEQKKLRSQAVQRCRSKRMKKLKEMAGGQCQVCGYSKCLRALEFHHVDKSSKEYGLSVLGVTRSWKSNVTEASKCALVCANCHREIEAGLIPELKSLGEGWKDKALGCGLTASCHPVKVKDGGSSPPVPAKIRGIKWS